MILNFLQKTRESIKDWIENRAHGKVAKIWLIIFSFTEASFFVIPPDIFLLAILINNGVKWVHYSLITTVSSVAGGLLGYTLGFFFFDLVGEFIIDTYNLQNQMTVVSRMFSQNAFWTIFISAFTPIPFKVFTLSAGFFKIDLVVFLIASLLGRGMRFFAVGYIVKVFGKQMARSVFKYFNWILLVLVILIILILVL
ncbi:MAG: VTT domain-containing protein [Patescibacteria group bacterium]|nr:VTT domain-containing protein [Patescibacteria group bacterium]